MEKLPDLLAEKWSQEFQRFEDKFCHPPARTNTSVIRSKRPSAQEREDTRYTPQGTLWSYLREHGEDMMKWHGKPTFVLDARVHELQGKTITNEGSSRKG